MEVTCYLQPEMIKNRWEFSFFPDHVAGENTLAFEVTFKEKVLNTASRTHLIMLVIGILWEATEIS